MFRGTFLIEGCEIYHVSNSTITAHTLFQPHNTLYRRMYRSADKSLARPGWKKATGQKILIFIYPIYNHNWRNSSTIYMYKTRLSSNEIFKPSNKIHREVDRAKDLSASTIHRDEKLKLYLR